MQILLATNNPHKVKEIGEILPDFKENFVIPSSIGNFPAPPENGTTYRENALKKALYYHKITGLPAIADDSGLEIEALGGEPGILSARFINPDLSFNERNRMVLEKMEGIEETKRAARFVCCCVLVAGEDEVRTEYGILKGKIGWEMKGEYGFGYDPIFALKDGRHLAQLPPEEKNRISHRAKAFKKMKKHIRL